MARGRIKKSNKTQRAFDYVLGIVKHFGVDYLENTVLKPGGAFSGNQPDKNHEYIWKHYKGLILKMTNE